MNRFSVASTALLHCAGVYFDIFRMSKNVRPRLVNVTEIEYGWIGHISLSHKSLRMCVWVGVSEWVSEWVCVCVWEREREERERREREKREREERREKVRYKWLCEKSWFLKGQGYEIGCIWPCVLLESVLFLNCIIVRSTFPHDY